MKDPEARYIAIDVEASGLDPRRDLLLQVAVIVVDQQLNELGTYESPILYTDHTINLARHQAPEVVVEMHEKTGLWERCSSDEAKAKEDVGRDLRTLFEETCPDPRKTRLFGSSVHFDKAMLEANMPSLADFYHYRVMDVSSLAEFANVYFDVPFMEKRHDHEAMSDIRESLAEFRHIYSALFGGI